MRLWWSQLTFSGVWNQPSSDVLPRWCTCYWNILASKWSPHRTGGNCQIQGVFSPPSDGHLGPWYPTSPIFREPHCWHGQIPVLASCMSWIHEMIQNCGELVNGCTCIFSCSFTASKGKFLAALQRSPLRTCQIFHGCTWTKVSTKVAKSMGFYILDGCMVRGLRGAECLARSSRGGGWGCRLVAWWMAGKSPTMEVFIAGKIMGKRGKVNY